MTQRNIINTTNLKHADLSCKVINAFYNVYNNLGFGFLEKVYENALFLELEGMGLQVRKEEEVPVFYPEEKVGEYFADLIVEGLVVVELKAAQALCKDDEIQLINYLKATDIEVGLLLNFGKRPEFKRKVFIHNKHS